MEIPDAERNYSSCLFPIIPFLGMFFGILRNWIQEAREEARLLSFLVIFLLRIPRNDVKKTGNRDDYYRSPLILPWKLPETIMTLFLIISSTHPSSLINYYSSFSNQDFPSTALFFSYPYRARVCRSVCRVLLVVSECGTAGFPELSILASYWHPGILLADAV